VTVLALHLGQPHALWLLLLAVPLVAAHLLKRRRMRVVVPHVALLLDARGAVSGSGVGRRLRELAPLACRLLALAALVLVVARAAPEPPREPVPLALVVDADVTGEVREADGRSRLEHALGLAAAHVRAHDEGPVSVVLAAGVPRVLAQASDDREALAQRLLDPALAATLRTGEAGDLGAAALQARRLVPPPGLVRVLSARAWSAPEGTDLALEGVGAADDDQGLVDLAVGPVAGSERMRVTVAVHNDAPRVARRTVALRGERLEAQVRELTLEPGGRAEVAFDVLVPRGGAHVQVELDGRDAFARNDRVEAVLAGPLRPSVLAVHGGQGLRPYTAAALEALGDRIDREASGAVAVAELAGARARDVTLVDGVALPPELLRPGAWIFLAPLAGTLPFEVGPAVQQPLVWRALAGHPLVLDLDLADAWLSRGTPLKPAPDVVGLAFASADEPVLAEGQRAGVRWVALGLETEGSDLPVRAAFPLLVRNAIVRLARAPAEALPPFVRAGDPLRARLPLPGGPEARVAWPDGPTVEAPLTPEVGPQAPFRGLGLVTVRTQGSGDEVVGRTAVVDLDAERTIRPARPAAVPPPPREAPAEPPWALCLALLAAALLALDLLLTRATRAALGGASAGPALDVGRVPGLGARVRAG
jgi:hypothetical protein